MEQQLYKKQGRKYIPIGYADGFSGFPAEGIWIVYNKPGCSSSSCIAQVGEFKNIDYSKFATVCRDKEDNIIRILMKKESRSASQIAREILEELSNEKS